ncbi:MAG TPA: PD-(D/E)XK nuclease family protein [Polyangiaceae bacterium]
MTLRQVDTARQSAKRARPYAAAWTVDADRFRTLVDQISAALRAYQAPPLHAAWLGTDTARVGESLQLVADAGRAARADLGTSIGSLPALVGDAVQAASLSALITELSGLWRARVLLQFGLRRVPLLRSLLQEPAPDVLHILRKEHDENAHSDILRWLLDPRSAPTLAPGILRRLVARLPDADKCRAALEEGLGLGCVYVRRESVIGNDLNEDDNRDRIDLMIEAPRLVVGIENKISASEHEGQTSSYERWLRALSKSKNGSNGSKLSAGLFLSPSGMPASSSFFASLSYFELCICLLDAVTDELLPTERQILAGYMKTLETRILRAQFQAVLTWRENDERSK